MTKIPVILVHFLSATIPYGIQVMVWEAPRMDNNMATWFLVKCISSTHIGASISITVSVDQTANQAEEINK